MTEKAKKIGKRPFYTHNVNGPTVTYRQWLIGQALASCSAMPYVVNRDPRVTNEEILQGCAEYAVRCADMVLEKLAEEE